MEQVTIKDNFAVGEGSAIYVSTPNGDLTFGPKNIIMPHNSQSVLFIEQGAKLFINPDNRID